jgi:hypothetical protein
LNGGRRVRRRSVPVSGSRTSGVAPAVGSAGEGGYGAELAVWKRVVVKPEGDCELLVKERQVEIDGEQMVDERRFLAEDSDHVASRMGAAE